MRFQSSSPHIWSEVTWACIASHLKYDTIYKVSMNTGWQAFPRTYDMMLVTRTNVCTNIACSDSVEGTLLKETNFTLKIATNCQKHLSCLDIVWHSVQKLNIIFCQHVFFPSVCTCVTLPMHKYSRDFLLWKAWRSNFYWPLRLFLL